MDFKYDVKNKWSPKSSKKQLLDSGPGAWANLLERSGM